MGKLCFQPDLEDKVKPQGSHEGGKDGNLPTGSLQKPEKEAHENHGSQQET